jgi:hypothetical protein
MQEIELKDLEMGDEIIISCQSHFKYLRVLKKPVIGSRVHWRTKQPLYKAVKCSTRREDKVITYTYNGGTRSYTKTTYIFTPEDHNHTSYVNLSERQIILVKKNN